MALGSFDGMRVLALESRRATEIAKLFRAMMQKGSRQRRKSMREIAEAVILSDELRRAAAKES